MKSNDDAVELLARTMAEMEGAKDYDLATLQWTFEKAARQDEQSAKQILSAWMGGVISNGRARRRQPAPSDKRPPR